MKTPTAILIGLILIAAAILFREPAVNPAHAASGGAGGISCADQRNCAVLNGDIVYFLGRQQPIYKQNWKTGVYTIVHAKFKDN